MLYISKAYNCYNSSLAPIGKNHNLQDLMYLVFYCQKMRIVLPNIFPFKLQLPITLEQPLFPECVILFSSYTWKDSFKLPSHGLCSDLSLSDVAGIILICDSSFRRKWKGVTATKEESEGRMGREEDRREESRTVCRHLDTPDLRTVTDQLFCLWKQH